MRRSRSWLAVLMLAALGLASCGSTNTVTVTRTVQTPPPVAPNKSIDGHPCSTANEVFQCVLPNPPAQLAPGPASGTLIKGVDFAWGAPSASSMVAHGWRFGASYLSYDGSKGWTQRPGLVSSYHERGVATVAVWETTAARAGQGCVAGWSDAQEARRQAARLGNTSSTIDFAIDFDASGGAVSEYFRCAHGILGSRTGAYGGYYPLKYLCARGYVGHENWQTYAWSRSQWLPASCAPLEQYLNDGSVDYDRAIAPRYGQWGGPAPAPPASRAVKLRALRHLERRVIPDERARIRTLRKVQKRYGCSRRRHEHKKLGPVCIRRFREGDRAKAAGDLTHRQIRALRRALGLH